MKKAVQNLKCGGPTKKMKKGMKKFANGSIDTSNIKMPTLASAIDKLTLAPGPVDPNNGTSTNTGSTDAISKGADFISDTFGGVMDDRKNALLSNIDNREDPSSIMKKSAGLDTAKSLVSGTAKGAAIAGLPGAIAGFAISGLARIIGTKDRLAAEAKATEKWSNSWSAKTATSMKESGYVKGGITEDTRLKGNQTKKPDSFNVYKNIKYPLTDINVVNKMIELGYHDDRNILLKMTPEERQKFIPEGSPITYEKVKKGTANQGKYKYYENGKVMVGPENSFNMTPVARLNTGLKTGGSIEGKGTGKSDSIPMKAPEGSFIVPTENADHAEELGKSFLGWNKEEKAKRNNGGTDIKVSDGEVFFTPDEVHVLKYHGVNLDELAPKAENKIGMKKGGMYIKPENKGKETATEKRTGKNATELAHSKNPVTAKRGNFARMAKRHFKPLSEGGLVHNLKIGGPVMKFKNGTKSSTPITDWTHDKTNDLVINDKAKTAYDRSGSEYAFNIYQNKYVKLKSGSPYGIDIYNQTTKQGDTDTPAWLKNLPELSGALQAAGGAYGLMQAGKAPDITVSRSLTKLSGEVRKLAEFGYEPAVLNALNNEIETTRMNISTSINNEGGSGLEKMSKLNNLLSITIDKKAGLAFANAAEKSRKWADVLKVDTMKAGQEFDINKIKLEDWYKNQEVFAGLVTAGISNIVGARQLKSEQDTLKEIGGKNPTWTSRKP